MVVDLPASVIKMKPAKHFYVAKGKINIIGRLFWANGDDKKCRNHEVLQK